MNSSIKPSWTETLPDPLPPNPLALAAQWLAQARSDAAQPNPDAMILATVDTSGHPSARVVLCKEIDAPTGFILFYTNYQSRKGRELKMNPRAAVVFHWDHRHRQVRAEGRVAQLPDAENDAYFRTRPWQSRIGAWASQQSEPVQSRARGRRRIVGGGGISHPRPRTLDANGRPQARRRCSGHLVGEPLATLRRYCHPRRTDADQSSEAHAVRGRRRVVQPLGCRGEPLLQL